MASEASSPTASELLDATLQGDDFATEEEVLSRMPAVPNGSILTRTTYEPKPMLTTVHRWPSMEPMYHAKYHAKLLGLPLRKDILHRAVIFEADGSRQGTASTKWRSEIKGSNRKIQPQKGSGRARVGDKKSPIRRGGGVAFGPKPRDFSTDLPSKVYDLAWRMALSYRYKKGELFVVDGTMGLPEEVGTAWLNSLFRTNHWGKSKGRSTLITRSRSHDLWKEITMLEQGKEPNVLGKSRTEEFFKAMEEFGTTHAVLKDVGKLDVKNLLETGRLIIEKRALDALLCANSSDLGFDMNLKGSVFHPWKVDSIIPSNLTTMTIPR